MLSMSRRGFMGLATLAGVETLFKAGIVPDPFTAAPATPWDVPERSYDPFWDAFHLDECPMEWFDGPAVEDYPLSQDSEQGQRWLKLARWIGPKLNYDATYQRQHHGTVFLNTESELRVMLLAAAARVWLPILTIHKSADAVLSPELSRTAWRHWQLSIGVSLANVIKPVLPESPPRPNPHAHLIMTREQLLFFAGQCKPALERGLEDMKNHRDFQKLRELSGLPPKTPQK
jgi:hypothetical protein